MLRYCSGRTLRQCLFSTLTPALALLLVLALVAPMQAKAQEVGEIIFSEQIDDDWYPIDPGYEFANNVLNLVFERAEPFGVNAFIFTVDLVTEQGMELLHQETIEIDPEWNFFLIRDLAFPDVGTYNCAYFTPDGDLVAEGVVDIVAEVHPTEEMPERQPQESLQGKTLKDIFNKYKPKE